MTKAITVALLIYTSKDTDKRKAVYRNLSKEFQN